MGPWTQPMGQWPGPLAEGPVLGQTCSSWGYGLFWPSWAAAVAPPPAERAAGDMAMGWNRARVRRAWGGAHRGASLHPRCMSQPLGCGNRYHNQALKQLKI